MNEYRAPLGDIGHALRAHTGLGATQAPACYRGIEPDIVAAVLEQGARFAERIVAPLNGIGDLNGCRIENGVVRTAPGFADAYRAFAEGGWQGVPADPDVGGQGLPWSVAVALQEMWYAANMSFSLCSLLTQGAIDLLETHATAAQRARYLVPLVEGRWCGTMNMTEANAGSDVGALTTRARPDGDGWRLAGQKIFITFGDHDMAENIVHLVLARTPDAPPGSKGISLFIVPKFLVNADGSVGARNDVRCLSLERKLGIHASPTCVMSFGDDGGAWGELVGQANEGMALMFTMMNNARLAVAIQGLGAAERAWQAAIAYAHQRRQGRLAGERDSTPIVRHPDVTRMLMTMRSLVDAMRGLIYYTTGAMDRARRLEPGDARNSAHALTDFLTPIAKAWCTDRGCEVADIGIQVHGGLGFIEQTGAAQLYRDARITRIYEGTNGIQAIDLMARKLCRDEGRTALHLCDEMRTSITRLGGPATDDPGCRDLLSAIDRLESCSRRIVAANSVYPARALSAATPYLRLAGDTIAGWRLMEAATDTHSGTAETTRRLGESARYFAARLLPETLALEAEIDAALSADLGIPEALRQS